MSVIIDNLSYELLPDPVRNGYAPTRMAPKISFTSRGGYKEQREAYPAAQWRYVYAMGIVTDAERNTVLASMDALGSDAFWFLVPESVTPRPDGTIVPDWRWVRFVDEETQVKPVAYGYWDITVTLEEV